MIGPRAAEGGQTSLRHRGIPCDRPPTQPPPPAAPAANAPSAGAPRRRVTSSAATISSTSVSTGADGVNKGSASTAGPPPRATSSATPARRARRSRCANATMSDGSRGAVSPVAVPRPGTRSASNALSERLRRGPPPGPIEPPAPPRQPRCGGAPVQDGRPARCRPSAAVLVGGAVSTRVAGGRVAAGRPVASTHGLAFAGRDSADDHDSEQRGPRLHEPERRVQTLRSPPRSASTRGLCPIERSGTCGAATSGSLRPSRVSASSSASDCVSASRRRCSARPAKPRPSPARADATRQRSRRGSPAAVGTVPFTDAGLASPALPAAVAFSAGFWPVRWLAVGCVA